MYCPTCGGKNDDGSAYCVTCGATLPTVADAKLSAPDEQRNQRETTSNSRSNPKQRHGCLTTYLIIMIIITSLAVVAIPASLSLNSYFEESAPDFVIPVTWATWVSLAANAAQIAFAVAIFKWKRWGVYAFIAVTVVELVLGGMATEGVSGIASIPDNMSALATTIGIVVSVMVAVLTIALLVVALKMGKPSGWDQLE